MGESAIRRSLVLVDSHGLVHAGRGDLDDAKRALALPVEMAAQLGLRGEPPAGLEAVVRGVRPSILVGTTGVGGTFTEPVIRALAAEAERPIVLPLSNPTSSTEATPSDVLRWSEGRAIVATGSPFPPVTVDRTTHVIGQANNVYVFPGLGLGAIVAEASAVSDGMLLAAARALADETSADQLAAGAIYPPVADLRRVSRAVALAVAREAVATGLAGIPASDDLEREIDRAMWWPAYVPYLPAAAGRR
jgi:malic enzyme